MTNPNATSLRRYPCTYCGAMRSIAEGGSIFTVCDDCWDRMLRGSDNDVWLTTLAANLTTAAGLCRAFRLGFDEGWNVTSDGFNSEYARITPDGYENMVTGGTFDEGRPEWRPGCGRRAP